MPTILSTPTTFTYSGGAAQVLSFAIPAGTWVSATWTRKYNNNFSEDHAHEVRTGASFANTANFPIVIAMSGLPTTDTIAATTAQLADINAAAGGTLAVEYDTTGFDPVVEAITAFTLTLNGAGGGSTTMTFERATVYEGVQIGVETTPGTAVPANKRLLGLDIDFDSMTDIKPYRPQGNKFFTTQQVGKEFTSGRIQGVLCFNDLLYLASSWLSNAVITTPANNSKWNVTGASGPWGFTFKGSVLAPATYATAAAAQTAIEGMTSVGTGNVKVTGAAPTFAIQFAGALSTDTSSITAPTGTPAPTIVLDTVGTLTRRWTFNMAPAGPDSITTFTAEKGAAGVANMAQQAAFGFVHGLAYKLNKSEASLNGVFDAQVTTDPFTMTASPTDVPCVPVDPGKINVWMGPGLALLQKMKRILDIEWGAQNRATGLITLNADDPSFSNRIETAPDLTMKFFQEHDADGQTMLARLRANTSIYAIVEALGPQIEPGFNYRMKWTLKAQLTKPNSGDLDGAYGKNYDAVLQYDPVLQTAMRLEIDTPLSTL
jgi:hypothetical protein